MTNKNCNWVLIPPAGLYDSTFECTICEAQVIVFMDEVDDPTKYCYFNLYNKAADLEVIAATPERDDRHMAGQEPRDRDDSEDVRELMLDYDWEERQRWHNRLKNAFQNGESIHEFLMCHLTHQDMRDSEGEAG